MTEFNEDDIRYVAGKYSEDLFDPERAITSLQSEKPRYPFRRLIITAAACAASFVVVFAGGYGIANHLKATRQAAEAVVSMPEQTETTRLNPDVSTTHTFIYDDAPLPQVLEELSSYFDCRLSSDCVNKRLSGTFADDDLDFIVSCIETVLDVKITIER